MLCLFFREYFDSIYCEIFEVFLPLEIEIYQVNNHIVFHRGGFGAEHNFMEDFGGLVSGI